MVARLDYARRLQDALERLSNGKNGSEALLVTAQPEAVRNSDVGHSYRQESFLHYLVGFDEPESALLLVPGGKDGAKVIAFVRPKNELSELWEGRRLGVEAAPKHLPVDAAFPIDELWKRVVEYVPGHHAIHYSLGRDMIADQHFIKALAGIRASRPRNFSHQIPVIDAAELAGEMRKVKTDDEIKLVEEAARITGLGFDRIYRDIRPGMNEREIHAMLISEYMSAGAEMEAYGSIVAGGANACVLHYVENNAPVSCGELLLVDSGAQFQYYASDVTRTIPVGREFTPPQRDLYQLVLAANEAAIAKTAPGVTLTDLHNTAVRVLVDGLIELKLLEGDAEGLIEKEAHKKYYPHNTSHWLGMDVHDVGPYRAEVDGKWQPVPLEAGMMLTVEPGLYIPESDDKAPMAFRGIGIRIEDDILVTPDGCRNLTSHIAKDTASLENRY